MRVAFLQHDPGSAPGLLGDALVDRGFELDLVPMASSIDHPHFDGAFPAVGDHDLVVPLGAIWSVYDVALDSWIDRELEMLRDLDRAGVPVLGVCFGGQALAAAHGGEVRHMGSNDIGWTLIDSHDEALLAGGPWLQWHGDHFTAPDDATVLATTDRGVQAFTLRANLGLQFHPEATLEILTTWLDWGGEAVAIESGTSRKKLLTDAADNRARARRDIDALLDWWLPSVGLG